MSLSSIFIPKRIKVGYQKRDDTYTKRLAYVIYYDQKGVLRKETSWEGWRDEKITPEEFDNVPTPGFILNKNIQRFNWNHFGSNRSYLRVYDPRGIEFEITPENLIGILMNTTCSKRGFEGEFVYAWLGKELMLLPTNSEEYQKAVTYTNLQDKKVSAKDIIPGCAYTTKKGEEFIYVGRYPWYEWKDDKKSNDSAGYRVESKKHIFYDPLKDTGKRKTYEWERDNYFFPKDDVSFLASCNNTSPVSSFAEIIDKFKNFSHSSPIWKWQIVPKKIKFELDKTLNHCPQVKGNFLKSENDLIHFYRIECITKWDDINKTYTISGYNFYKDYTLNTTTLLSTSHRYDNRYYYGNYSPLLTEDDIKKELETMYEAYIVLANGKKIKVENCYTHHSI